ncbi:MAG TPA: hypothetical protein VGN95_06750 [Pyrinomonadaceae bacterium]|jgi:hypothetical protein|nr:hypothetical protein [Pyrinomonadaceae bacterium]
MNEQNTGAKEATSEEAVDDRGTNQSEGRALLRNLRDRGFDSSDEKFAIALGRPIEEVTAWMGEGEGEPVDDDVIMKARGIAKERAIEIE